MFQEIFLIVFEIFFEVGFVSIFYFIKCFWEYYGYLFGKLVKGELIEEVVEFYFLRLFFWKYVVGVVVLVVFVIFFICFLGFKEDFIFFLGEIEKFIVVLFFLNESSDFSNMYFINGLMEVILNNLQKIEDLWVISCIFVEKY